MSQNTYTPASNAGRQQPPAPSQSSTSTAPAQETVPAPTTGAEPTHGHGHGVGHSIKAAAAGIHGVGESLRGNANAAVDRAMEDPEGVRKNEAIAREGEREVQTGEFSRGTKKREMGHDRHQLDELYSGRFPTDHPSEVIKIPSSISDYLRMHEAFEDRNSSVRVLFNPQLSTVSILKATAVQQTLIAKVYKSLLTQLPAPNFDALGCCEMEGSQAMVNFLPLEATMQLLYTETESSDPVPVLTLQVGFSEAYDELLLETRRTIEETTDVQATILINVKETPSYENPFRDTAKKATYRNRDTGENESIGTIIERLRLTPQEGELRLEIRREIPDDVQSPLLFRGVQWAGRLRMELEIWVRDSETGKATRRVDPIVIYGEGAQEDSKLDLRLAEFVPSDDVQYRRNLRLDWKKWQNHFEYARKKMVISRVKKAVENLFVRGTRPKSREKSTSEAPRSGNQCLKDSRGNNANGVDIWPASTFADLPSFFLHTPSHSTNRYPQPLPLLWLLAHVGDAGRILATHRERNIQTTGSGVVLSH
ncbi:hypothetical protein FQN50_004127 [Emmonsiellopsis sp. PD_5]|nr:hypothetical protein FQN50_004127 [Emmonsiellopsis sp. PD_5]